MANSVDNAKGFSPEAFSFLLLPEFSLMALTAAIDPLRHANKLLGYDHYGWQTYSETGEKVVSSSGVEISPKGALGDVPIRTAVIVCGGPNISAYRSAALRHWLRRMARMSPLIGGLCTASHILADAGLLDGYRATIHWEMAQGFRETFPRTEVTDRLFELDRDRMTCAGETAGIDMMVTLLAERHGQSLAAKVAAQVLHGRIRSASEPQAPPALLYGTRNRVLSRAIELMEANTEAPLGVEAIIKSVGCSRRQIERLFQKHLSCSPSQFYRNMRLDRGRQLLTETLLSCTEISIACGFGNPSSFSKSYRQKFGVSPFNERGIPRILTDRGIGMSSALN